MMARHLIAGPLARLGVRSHDQGMAAAAPQYASPLQMGGGLALDASARRVLAGARPGRAIAITVTYRPTGRAIMPALDVRWRRAQALEGAADLVLVAVHEGVPCYAERRVAAYLCWQRLALTGWTAWRWSGFALVREPETWGKLIAWEQMHPGLAG